MPKLSITAILAIALAVSLGFSGHLILRSEVWAVIFSPLQAKELTAAPTPLATLTQSEPAVLAASPSSEVDVLLAQLQEMQSKIQASSSQLEQKYPSGGIPSYDSGGQVSPAGEDAAALWAEIEQLNQIMQPLMVQLESASANRSSRPASEWFALRTQVNTIHQRLANLMARVQVAQARAKNGTGVGSAQWSAPVGSPANSTSPDQAAYEQLYQNMAELQSLLQQMQVSP